MTVVYCDAMGVDHRGMHYEAYDCRFPHEVTAQGRTPVVQDETGDRTGERY